MNTLTRRWQSEAQAAAQEQAATLAAANAQLAEREAQVERIRLQGMHAQRILWEEFDNMSEPERAEFEDRTDPVKVATQLAEKAMAKAKERFNADNESQRLQELKELRNVLTGFEERHAAIKQANAKAKARDQEFGQRMEDHKLQSEEFGDPLHRIVNSLPVEAQRLMSEFVEARPRTLEVIKGVKHAAAQREGAQRDAELMADYESEIKPARGNFTQAALIRSKFRALGLNI
jgi:uncharacterized coiled-coil protein SlyX